MGAIVMHHIGTGMLSPCGLEPASVYRGFQGGFTTDWTEVDCAACLAKAPAGVVPPTLQDFYVTFGVKYRYEKHEHWESAHPDGWLLVQAEDYAKARDLVDRYIGNVFAFMYEPDRFDAKWHPLGELARITPDGATATGENAVPVLLPETEPTKTVRVSWYETTHYTYNIEVPLDFSLEQDDADEILEQRICELDTPEMDGAFSGTTDRQVTNKEWA